jgi:hypothetical protein
MIKTKSAAPVKSSSPPTSPIERINEPGKKCADFPILGQSREIKDLADPARPMKIDRNDLIAR